MIYLAIVIGMLLAVCVWLWLKVHILQADLDTTWDIVDKHAKGWFQRVPETSRDWLQEARRRAVERARKTGRGHQFYARSDSRAPKDWEECRRCGITRKEFSLTIPPCHGFRSPYES